MKKHIYQDFDNNFEDRKKEIIKKKDIKDFYNKYCRIERNEAAFCAKLFHTVLPNEFPPLDNPIKNHFKLQNTDFIESVLIVKKAYRLFIKENQDKIQMIRTNLSKTKFEIIRINELSDFRLLDMYYWLIISREESKNKNKKTSIQIPPQTKINFEGRDYLWNGDKWIDLKTFVVPTEIIREKLNKVVLE